MDLWLLLPWIKRNHLRTPTEIGCFKYYYLFACFCCLWHICYAFNWFTNSHQISVVSSGEIQESRDTRFSVPTNSWNPTKQNPVYKNNCKNQILNPENWTKTWKFLRKEKKIAAFSYSTCLLTVIVQSLQLICNCGDTCHFSECSSSSSAPSSPATGYQKAIELALQAGIWKSLLSDRSSPP